MYTKTEIDAPIRSLYVKAVGAALAFALLSTTGADARPSTKSYSCQGVKQLISQRGAVVMDTKNRSVYRRFVSSRRQCQLTEKTERFTVPTSTGRCRLLVCKDINFEDF